MGFARSAEVKRTYDVDAGAILPTLAGIGLVSTATPPTEMFFEDLYFDTPDLDLARQGVTLGRRTGGHDAGWHLMIPQEEDTSTEVHLPLGDRADPMPDELMAPIHTMVRVHDLVPVARASIRRLEYKLLREDSVVLAQVCDDWVHSERLHGSVLIKDWREWEVELVDGDRVLLAAVDQQLSAAGAAPGKGVSKLARSLDDSVPEVFDPPTRKQLSSGSVGQVVTDFLAVNTAELQRQETRLRAGQAGSVHHMRIATRRLRSALKTYRPLFEPSSIDGIGDDLRWLGQSLNDARDAQVLRERLLALVATESPELVLGPVVNRIDDDLRAAERAGLEQALQALDSDRYFRLLDALDKLVRSAPLVTQACSPAREVLPGLLQRDAKRLRRAVEAIARSGTPLERDIALHEVRKKAKRVRYAAESAIPVLKEPAQALSSSAKKVQQVLGEHQDAVVSRQRLLEYGAHADDHGENGFTFGRLHALEQSRADDAEREFEVAWKTQPGKDLRDWAR